MNVYRRGVLAGLAGLSLMPPQVLAAGSAGYTYTRGGAGGRIIRVTTLARDGEGSLKSALEAKGPRIVVFEVGGVIDLDKQTLKVTEPYLTLAGETAPDPGITLIKGGVQISTHDVIFRHMAIRPGTAGMARGSGFEPDALSITAGRDIIVDHCSLTWAIDEALSASGPRFNGEGPDDWRRNTSHRVTFSHNLIAQSLHDASHAKGPHSMGSLVHDNVTGVLIYGNLYAHNNERHPLVKGGGHCAVINNVFVNPGTACGQYTLVEDQWTGRERLEGQMILRGNVMRGGPDTKAGLPMLLFGGAGDLRLHAHDNIATYQDGREAPVIGYYQARPDGHPADGPYVPKGFIKAMPREQMWPQGIGLRSGANTEAFVYRDCGARPWARDPMDARIVAQAKTGTGRIIHNESEAGGYPAYAPSRRKFVPSSLL